MSQGRELNQWTPTPSSNASSCTQVRGSPINGSCLAAPVPPRVMLIRMHVCWVTPLVWICMVDCPPSLGAQLTGQSLAVQVTTWMQCGGKRGPNGASMQDSSVCCPGEAPCTYVSDWYWQCLAGGQGGAGSRPSSNSGCTKVSAAVRHLPEGPEA